MVFWTFCYCLQMIILFLKMATFGWNNEWSYFFACSHLVMVVVSQFEKVSKNRLHKGINSKLVKLLTSVFSNSFILTLKEMEKTIGNWNVTNFSCYWKFLFSFLTRPEKKLQKKKKEIPFWKMFLWGLWKELHKLAVAFFQGSLIVPRVFRDIWSTYMCKGSGKMS